MRVELRAVGAARRPRGQAAAVLEQARQQHALEQAELLGIAEEGAVRDRDRAAEARPRHAVAGEPARELAGVDGLIARARARDLLGHVLGPEVGKRQPGGARQQRFGGDLRVHGG